MATTLDCRDICPIPGHCCKNFGYGIAKRFTALLPFLSLQQLHELCNLPPYMVPIKREGTTLIVDCTMLGTNGLCTIYDDRPQFCKDFQPYTNALCCLWQAPSRPANPQPVLYAALSAALTQESH